MDHGPASVCESDQLPDQMLEWLTDPEITKIAWNESFDRAALSLHYDTKLPSDQWFDAMALAAACNLPLSLDACGEVLGLAEDERKQRNGKRLIRLFSIPNAKGKWNSKLSHPDDWLLWLEYGLTDTVALRTIYNLLQPAKHYVMPPSEERIYRADVAINETGVPVDLDLSRSVIHLNDAYRAKRRARGQMITRLDNPNSPQQLDRWLKEGGVSLPDMRADTLRRFIASCRPGDVRAEAAQIRLDLSRSSVAKFQQIVNRAAPDGRLYDTLQYHAAITGRWGGRGVQLHNLPRGVIKGDSPEEVLEEINLLIELVEQSNDSMIEFLYPSVSDVLGSLVRPALCAPEGQLFAVADYASIETAVIAWLANCVPLLNVFRQGRDPYVHFASVLLGKPEDRVTKADRNYAKPAMLGCVFGLGAGGYLNYAANFGQQVDYAEAERVVNTFRETYPEIPRFWHQLRNAATAVLQGAPGAFCKAGERLLFHKERGQTLFLQLPSGRSIAYPEAKLTPVKTDWGMRDQIQYSAEVNYNWVTVATHPGKIAENATQAVARDLMGHGLVNALDEGFEIPLHIHDEIIGLVPEEDETYNLETLIEVMTRRPEWGADIPVSADGFTTPRYLKF